MSQDSPAAILYDASGNPVAVTLNGGVYKLGVLAGLPGVQSANTSTTPLGSSAVFTGTWEDVSDYGSIRVSVKADVASLADGMEIQWSSDGATISHIQTADVAAGVARAFTVTPRGRYFRVVYRNAASAQSTFSLRCVLAEYGPGIQSDPLDASLAVDTFAQPVRAVMTGLGPGGYGPVMIDGSGNITVSVSSVINTLPLMVNLQFNQDEGAVVADAFKRVSTYTVPAGYFGYIIRYMSWQNETAVSRLVAEKAMGTLSVVTNTYTPGDAYAAPQWTSIITAEVTTALSSGGGSITITVTYTNAVGTGGRTGTVSIPKGSAVGSRWPLVLQAGDNGVLSIQNIQTGTTLAAGAIKVLGLIQLVRHEDRSNTVALETVLAAGAIAFPPGTVLGLEFAGSGVSKRRTLDTLIQLVEE